MIWLERTHYYTIWIFFSCREKEAHLERIRNFLSHQLEKVKTDEDERIQKVLDQKEAEFQKQELEKAERNAKAIAEINAHRLEQIERHRKELEAEKEAELEEVRQRIAAELALSEYESKCLAKRNEAIKQQSKDYLEQAVSSD